MTNHSPFPIISVEGNAHERGCQYGSQAKTLVEESLSVYRRKFECFSNRDWDECLREGEKFIPFIEEYDPEIMEEIAGIAEGSGRTIEEIVTLNARSELVGAQRWIAQIAKVKGLEGCTTLAATSEATLSKHMFMAQNWDYWLSTQKLNVILKIKQKGKPNIVQVAEAGLVAKVGFNSAGIGLCANGSHSDKWGIGVPFQVILRGILNARSMADAILAILRAKRASSCFYLIGRDGEAIDIEAAPNDYNYIFPDNGTIAHSNHFLIANPNIKDFLPSSSGSTLFRQYRMKKLLNKKCGDITIDTIKEIQRDHFDKPHSICAHVDKQLAQEHQAQTNFSLIMDLNNKTLHIALGPPCENEYTTLDFADFLR